VSIRPIYVTVLSLMAFSLVACTGKAQANDDPKESVAAVSEALPQSVKPYTLEEIRAEQKRLEAQIADIRAKAKLERADKIAVLKLQRQLINFENIESVMLNKIIQDQKAQLKKEFSSIRRQIKE